MTISFLWLEPPPTLRSILPGESSIALQQVTCESSGRDEASMLFDSRQ